MEKFSHFLLGLAVHVLKRLTEGDLFRIELVISYSEDYHEYIDKVR